LTEGKTCGKMNLWYTFSLKGEDYEKNKIIHDSSVDADIAG
jgi:hypothetical protein